MTIHIERDALLQVVCHPTSHREGPSIACDELINVCEHKGDQSFCAGPYVQDIPKLTRVESFGSDCTVTTADSSSVASFEDDRRVSFAPELVTDVFERERTPQTLIPKLFYSTEETARFRQEYRLERKLLAELDVDPETHPVDEEELSALFSAGSLQASNRHRISRVVVLHNDKLETFLNPDAEVKSKKTPASDDFFDNDSFWSGSITWY